MLLDEKYKKYLWHYRTKRCNGPADYTFKKHGFRLLYGEQSDICGGCKKHRTNWFILYSDPRHRFKPWDVRPQKSRMICSEEDIDEFLAHVLMERVNDSV